MLPRMPGIKAAVFTRRIVGFHETFAPVGSFEHSKPIAMVWHEGNNTYFLNFSIKAKQSDIFPYTGTDTTIEKMQQIRYLKGND